MERNFVLIRILTYTELCQVHRIYAVSKTLVFRWHKKFQDGFTNFKDGSRPGQPKTVVTKLNANTRIAAATGLIKRDSKLTVKNIAHNIGIGVSS